MYIFLLTEMCLGQPPGGIQTNSNDRSMWVLVTIATVLLGYTHNTNVEVLDGKGVPEGCIDIKEICKVFYELALRVPSA
jgi:hypothetical protein